jgi:protein-S-isoprenylcysteine O-methyltransferase Ste14
MMALKTELETQGQWLFHRRSYLPLATIPVALAVLADMRWPFGSFQFHEVWELACLAVSFAGLGVRILAVGYVPAGTSGRNTDGQWAESLNTTGVYSVVRHPLYLGNFLIGLGAALVPFAWWLPLLYLTTFWLYYERIMFAEETYLQNKFGEQFIEWASRTPAFVPRLSRWQPAVRPFSLRTVLKREYTGLMVVIMLHAGIEVAEHWIIECRIPFEPFWELLLGGGAMCYLVLRMLKKHTRILEIPGR